MPILGFKDKYSYLSNMYITEITFKHKFISGFIWANSSEHIYQAYKAKYIEDFENVINASDPQEAKRLGRVIEIDKAFKKSKLQIMERIVRAKFSQNKTIKKLLLETGSKYIEETNDWDDIYWGVCKGVGQNNLGKILMKIREELRSK